MLSKISDGDLGDKAVPFSTAQYSTGIRLQRKSTAYLQEFYLSDLDISH